MMLAIPLAFILGSTALAADIGRADLAIYATCTSSGEYGVAHTVVACNRATTKLAHSAQAAMAARSMAAFSHLYVMTTSCMVLEGNAEVIIGDADGGGRNLTIASRAFRSVIRNFASAADIRQAKVMLKMIGRQYGGAK